MLDWIRRHPVRLATYALLIAGAAWAGITLLRDPYGLLARAVESAWLRSFVLREFGVRYAVGQVAVANGCGSLAGLDVELTGIAKARIENLHACLSGNVEAGGIAIGGQTIRVESVRFRAPQTVQGEGFAWRDGSGELASAQRFTATGVQGLSVPDIATVQFASYTPDRVELIGTHALVDRAALAPVPARFQAAANGLLAMARAALPFPARWSATAWRLLLRILIGATAVLLLLKIPVTRAPLWAMLAPFNVFPLLALVFSWVAIVVAAPVVALLLWAVAYRRAPEWQQRWEPVAVDVLVVLLALPMLALLSWPGIPTVALPSIERFALAQLDVRDTTAIIREQQCGTGDLAVVSIPEAAASNLSVDGTNVDVERASASGEVRAGVLNVPFTVDYRDRRAHFSAEWPATAAVKGSADLAGARIDDLHTLPGAPVHIRKAVARVAWPRDLAGKARVEGIEASGATIDTVSADFHAGLPCGGSNRFRASATLGGIAASGPIRVSVPEAAVNLAGSLSDQRLEAEAGVSTERLSIPPLRFTADLQRGDFDLPRQHITLTQAITTRLPGSIEFDLEASRDAAHIFIPKLVPDVAPAGLELTGLKIDVDAAGPKFAIGGNKLTLPELPGGFTFSRISSLRVTTRGELDQPPTFELPSFKVPSIDIAQITTRNLKASLPGLKLESIDVDLAGPLAASVHLTDSTSAIVLSQPVAATVSTTPVAARFALTAPLDTAQFGVPGTVANLRASADFAQNKLAAFEVEGTADAAPLTAPATFHVTNRHATFSAPSITLLPRLWLSAAGSIDFTLAPAPLYPVLDRLTEAAAGLRDHIQNANHVFGDPEASVFPVRWDLDLEADNATLTPEKLAAEIHTTIRNLEVARQTIDGALQLTAGAALADDHLLLHVSGPADIGALGRRWKLDTPVSLALRRELRPGANGSLFDSAYYGRFTLALGYGASLQAHTALRTPLLYGTAGGVAEAAIRWQPAAAIVDSLGDFSFAGLTPTPYLEDRLDGKLRFRTNGMPIDRLFVPQLQADPSRIGGLDRIDLSLAVRRSRDTASLPGIVQIALGLDVKPANEILRLITDSLNVNYPPSALSYRNLALDFQVEQGRVRTAPALLTLSGVQMQGVNGLVTDSDLHLFWGGRGRGPSPRLRDLIYNFQRAIVP